MILERWTFPVKAGAQNEVVDILRNEFERYAGYRHDYRICVPMFGRQNVVVVDWEHDDLTTMTEVWDGWKPAEPESYWQRWNELTEPGSTREIMAIASHR